MTPVWGWIVAYVLGFLLFQLLIYWYFGDEGASIERPIPDSSDRDHAPRSTVEPGDVNGIDAGETVRCKHCGATNEFDPTFTYCRECTGAYR